MIILYSYLFKWPSHHIRSMTGEEGEQKELWKRRGRRVDKSEEGKINIKGGENKKRKGE